MSDELRVGNLRHDGRAVIVDVTRGDHVTEVTIADRNGSFEPVGSHADNPDGAIPSWGLVFARVRQFIARYPADVAAVARKATIVVPPLDDSAELERRLSALGYKRIVGAREGDPIHYVRRTAAEQVEKDALDRRD